VISSRRPATEQSFSPAAYYAVGVPSNRKKIAKRIAKRSQKSPNDLLKKKGQFLSQNSGD
jgi:hypothetical protein